MKKQLLGLALTGAMAATVLAQDSVGSGGLPGDALSPWDTANQRTTFAVDLTPFKASWGTDFAIAPIVKASKSSDNFFSSLLSAQSMSRLQDISAEGNTFGVVFSEYGGPHAGIIGGLVSYDPTDPLALTVERVVAATAGADDTETLASFGVGSVDELGNVLYRADDFGIDEGSTLAGNNIIWTDLAARADNTLNVIGSGTTDATVFAIENFDGTVLTPNIGPESVFGNEPYVLANGFGSFFDYGPAGGTISGSSDHIDSAIDFHNGNMSYMTRNWPGLNGTNGTAALLGKIAESSDGDQPTPWINIFGLNADGSPAGTLAVELPTDSAAWTDASNGTTVLHAGVLNEFGHDESQTPFRGGNGQVALGIDQAGRGLAAATVYLDNEDPATPGEVLEGNPLNAIMAYRSDGEWSVVAYNVDESGFESTGKPIYGVDEQGQKFQMGYLEGLDVTIGSSNPSMSAPMIDSVGNVWFTSAVVLTHFKDGVERNFPDNDAALIRAVYNPDEFSYELELVFELGERFLGQNSGKQWQVRFMPSADSNSVSSQTPWSSNISELGFLGAAPSANLPTAAPDGLGGLVLGVEIGYDVNEDGTIDANDGDEEYNVLLYVSANPPTPAAICGDSNCDGVVDFFDIDPFVTALVAGQAVWESQYDCDFLAANNINGDDSVDFFDIDGFVTAVLEGGCQ